MIGIIALFYVAYDFTRCYNFYGHKFDRLPHSKVRFKAFIFVVVWWIAGWSFFFHGVPNKNVEILSSMLAAPFLIVIANWTIKNWAANDYVFFIELNVQGIRPMSFDDQLKLFGDEALQAIDITKWWPRFKTFFWDWVNRFKKSFLTDGIFSQLRKKLNANIPSYRLSKIGPCHP